MSQSVAVIGASKDRSKFGNKAVRAYAQAGWDVYPVHPSAEWIEGFKCFHSVGEVPDPLDRVAVYVPPEVGKELLPEIAAKHPKEVFFNPGSEDEELFDLAEKAGLNAKFACSIVHVGMSPTMFGDK